MEQLVTTGYAFGSCQTLLTASQGPGIWCFFLKKKNYLFIYSFLVAQQRFLSLGVLV